MDITVHLFVSGDWEPDDLLRVDVAAGPDRWTRTPRLALDFACVAVGTFRAQDRPVWSRMLDGYFDVDWPRSVTASVVLVAQVEGRWFAVTFGHGRHLLREERLVADFGLRVTANAVPADRVRSISSVLLDAGSRRTAQSLSIPGELARFSVDLDGEWIRSLGGETESELSRGMTGSQSLTVRLGPASSDLKHLHLLLAHLLELYGASSYRERFPFIDLVVPLYPGDERVAALDARLVTLLPRAGVDVGVVAPDPQPGDPDVLTYELRRGRGRWTTLDAFGVQCAARDVDDPLSLAVRALGGDRAVIWTRPLRQFLSAEVELTGEQRYVLVEGRWFRVDPARLAWLEQRLTAIEEFGHNRLNMPDWYTGWREETYNDRAATALAGLLMDKQLFTGLDRRYDRVEVCDVLTADMDLVCVKRLSNAASMSHLLGQGSVSASLYHHDRVYRDHVRDAFRSRWPRAEEATPTVVYAIATDRSGPLHRALPFFSRISLVNHAHLIRRTGLRVALARIALTKFAIPPVTAALPQPRTERVGQLDLFDT